jgi:hypothetical protein
MHPERVRSIDRPGDQLMERKTVQKSSFFLNSKSSGLKVPMSPSPPQQSLDAFEAWDQDQNRIAFLPGSPTSPGPVVRDKWIGGSGDPFRGRKQAKSTDFPWTRSPAAQGA